MANIDFCCNCGGWIAANTGTMRTGPGGTAEIICNECLAIEQSRACALGSDYSSGDMIKDDDNGR